MEDLTIRTRRFSVEIIKLSDTFKYSISKNIVITQLVKSGTSVGANYRAARRARSDREFVSKINIVLEEADESAYWLEVIQELKWKNVDDLLKEANELTAIFVSILKKMNKKK